MKETIRITYYCEDEDTKTMETVPLSVVTLDDQGRAADIQTYAIARTGMQQRSPADLIDIVTNTTYDYLYGEEGELE